jgi:hypothetical protein
VPADEHHPLLAALAPHPQHALSELEDRRQELAQQVRAELRELRKSEGHPKSFRIVNGYPTPTGRVSDWPPALGSASEEAAMKIDTPLALRADPVFTLVTAQQDPVPLPEAPRSDRAMLRL